MKKYALVHVLTSLAVVCAPFSTSAATIAELQAQLTALMAQVAALQSQQTTPAAPQSGAAPTTSCLNLSRNLSRGMKGSDVTQLQQFLISQNLLAADSATGFFGAKTESAVKQWQTKQGIASSGTPATTGYGAVGPRTRNVMSNCSSPFLTPSTPTPHALPQVIPTTCPVPSYSFGCQAGFHPEKHFDAKGCEIVPKCVADTLAPAEPQMTSCTTLAPQTRTISCPAGQSGSITQTRSSSCPVSAKVPVWSAWEATSMACSDTFNTLDYFLDTHNQTLTGTHPVSQRTDGTIVYSMKWASDTYEIYAYDNMYVYLKEDHSGSPHPGSYTFSDGRWMKRSMKVGEQIAVPANTYQKYATESDTCVATTSGNFPYVMTLEQHVPEFNLGGDLGIQDVLVLVYDYRVPGYVEFEKFYYAKGRGLVKWELYRNDQVVQTSIFNTYSTTSPLNPDLSTSCRGL